MAPISSHHASPSVERSEECKKAENVLIVVLVLTFQMDLLIFTALSLVGRLLHSLRPPSKVFTVLVLRTVTHQAAKDHNLIAKQLLKKNQENPYELFY